MSYSNTLMTHYLFSVCKVLYIQYGIIHCNIFGGCAWEETRKKNDCNLLSGTVTVLCCVVLYYLGLENIHALTNTSTKYEVRFDLGLGSERAYAVYDDFKVGSAKQKFKLTIGNYRGNAGKMEA